MCTTLLLVKKTTVSRHRCDREARAGANRFAVEPEGDGRAG